MAGPAFDLNKLKNIKLTKEQQQYVVLGIVLVGGAIYGYWNFLIVPARNQIGALEKALVDKQANIEKARRLKAQWEEYGQRLARVQLGNAFVAKRMPPAVAVDLSLTRLIRMATEGGIYINQATGEPESARGKSEYEGFKKTTTSMQFSGDFHKLGDFLARLSGEDLVYLVDDVAMRGTSRDVQDRVHISTQTQFKLVSYFEIVKASK